MLQNSAVRMIYKLKPRDHVTPYLKDLKWLRIKEKIDFKILVHVYKCLSRVNSNSNPKYLCELVTKKEFVDHTRLSEKNILEEKIVFSTLGSKSFSYNAPRLWNNLSDDIKDCVSLSSFKKKLKIHFLNSAYL